MDWEEFHKVTRCEHPNRKPVRYVKSNGAVSVRLQCQRCGNGGSDVARNGYRVDDLPPFDKSLGDRWDAWRNALGGIARREMDETRQATRQAASDDWWVKYAAYLKTPHWAALRRRVIARDNFQCQSCARRITDADAQVHHLSYATFSLVGWSLPAECQALCRDCHDRITVASDRKRAAA